MHPLLRLPCLAALAGLVLAPLASPLAAQSFRALDGSDLARSAASASDFTPIGYDGALAGFGGALAISGTDVLVGEGENQLRPGHVYIYRRGADGTWSETGRLEAPDAEWGDTFGSALAADGEWLLVGAPGRAAVYLYRSSGGEWELTATLTSDEATEEGSFGASISLDAASGLAVIGAPGGESTRGGAHVFEADADGSWSEVGVLRLDGDEGGSAFGASTLLLDGRVLVGAPARNEQRGGVVIFQRGDDGEWQVAQQITPQAEIEAAAFGAALARDDDRFLVGAPLYQMTGAAFAFGLNQAGTSYQERARMVAFDGQPLSLFGSALAASGDEVWVGAPRALATRGAAYIFERGEVGFTGSRQLASDEAGRQAAYSGAMAVGGDIAVVGLLGHARGSGAVQIYERGPDGLWAEAAMFVAEAESLPVVTGETLDCEEGRVAAIFACNSVELLSFLPISEIGGEPGIRLNDTWGWHDEETGREIVLVGRTDGVSFVDITDPNNPIYLGEVLRTEGSPTAAWRDFKVFNDHAFIVADASGRHGMQIFNLRRLYEYDGEPITHEPDLTYDRIHSAHNIGLNEETGIVYIVGGSQGGETCGGGLHMVDVNDPMNPEFLGCFADTRTGRTGTGYSHDVQCVTYRGPDERYYEREICMGSNETHLSIADVTDKENPRAVSIATYPNAGYVHQGWFDEDHRYFYMQDELALMNGLIDNTRTVIFDVSDLEDPQVVGEFFFDTRAVSHNLYIRGDLIFEANYSSGLRILDISDRENPVEVGWIDTAPTHEAEPMFQGAWSTYPYFRNGVISVSSIGEGLFIVRFQDSRPVS